MSVDPRLQIFSYGKNFDYYSYLEQQSHFNRLALDVDKSILSIIDSNERLARENIQVMRDLDSNLHSGLVRLEVQLDRIGESVDQVAWICSEGFAKITLQLNHIGSKLESIERLTKNPSRTWAYEQYRIAKEAYLRNKFYESLSSINMALDGHESHLGYRLDHRFYLLRGLVRLGNNRNTDRQLVDVQAAKRDFCEAAECAAGAIEMAPSNPDDPSWVSEHEGFVEYRPQDYKLDQARSLGLAGWASYCDGDFENGKSHLLRCVETNPEDWRGRYDLSKACIRLGDTDTALDQLKILLTAQPAYARRAGADSDFLEEPSTLMGAIEAVRQSATHSLRGSCHQYVELLTPERIAVIAKYKFHVDTSLDPFFERLEVFPEKLALADLVEMRDVMPSRIEAIIDQMTGAARELKQKASRIKESDGETTYEKISKSSEKVYWISTAVIAVLIIVAAFSGPGMYSVFDILIVIILVVPFSIIFSRFIFAPIVTALWAVLFGAGSLIKQRHDKSIRTGAAEGILKDANLLDIGPN